MSPSIATCALSFLLSVAVLLFGITPCEGANIGDEQYGNLEGQVWVWTQTGGLNIIDPATGSIRKTVPVVEYSTMSWGDAVFMKDQADLRKYAFIADSGNNLMWVYDTDTQSLITKVRTGSKPVHVYSIPVLDEVWAHLDGDGSFDVFHMNQVRYRSSSAAAKDSAAIPGHGKLLVNPNLERTAFSTDVMAGIVTKIDTLLRKKVATLTISNSSMTSTTTFPWHFGMTCGGTHGIAFSDVDDSLYVECTNPGKPTCPDTFNTTGCTGSLWRIDTNSFLGNTENALQLGMKAAQPTRLRLSSPFLSNKLNIPDFGIQGQSYATPEEQFILSTNKNLNLLSIIKPVAGGVPLILEVEISYKPGAIVYWPKDSSITFGVDPNPGNYWAIVALESSDENAGLAFLDMDLVVKAFEAGLVMLDKSVIEYVNLGPGSLYRPLKRGNDYVATPIYDTTAKGYTKLAIVNARTRSVTTISLSKTSKIIWVPTFQASWSSTMASFSKALLDQNDKVNQAIAVGGVALAFTLGGFCAITALILYKRASATKDFPSIHARGIEPGSSHSSHARSLALSSVPERLSIHGRQGFKSLSDGDV
jgi:hypothetical protein